MALPLPTYTMPDSAGIKRGFANHVSRFVNRAQALPGAIPIAVGSIIAILFTTLSGAFGTGPMAVGDRIAFWTTLIGINAASYLAWFAWRVREPSGWWRASLIGMIVLTVPLPLEIKLASWVVSGEVRPVAPQAWLHGVGIGAGLLVIAFTLQFFWPRPEPAPQFTKGALWRHGVRDPAELSAIMSEDHYCRLHLADGSSRLVHGRFADLIAELAGSDGLVIRRGVWTSAAAVATIEREGRRLLVDLGNGERIAASASGRAAMRDAGWI